MTQPSPRPNAENEKLHRKIEQLTRERDGLAEELRETHELLVQEQNAQYAAYRQLVELERVRAFDDIARGIEHDLYNALTPVEGYTELLLLNPSKLADRAMANRYLTMILRASQDARQTVPKMREFYYSTNSIDLEQHETVNQVLSKALGDAAPAESEEELEQDFDTETLSPREWDVLKLLSDGLQNKEIATTLLVSENTVKSHIRAILSKLSLKNRTQAAAYALLDQRAYEPSPEDARKSA
jgi:ATP/maltotriose-dependent transcriptional regulator MalT